MEQTPERDINAKERMRAVSIILMQQLVINKTLQPDDLKELYEKLSLHDSATLIMQANRDAYALEGLAPEQSTALTLRISQEVFGRNPFSK